MRKLEAYINEKLRITKGSGVPNLILILESTNKEEFNLECENLLEYLKDDSNLPIAELEDGDFEDGIKKLSRKYQNTHDTFLWVTNKLINYGTWDDRYTMFWSIRGNCIKNHIIYDDGFNNFVCEDQELAQSKGVFIITKNSELMKQIDVLMKKIRN